MAGPRTCRNPPPTGKNKLAEDASEAPIKGSGTPTPTSAVFCAPTPAPAQASVLGLPGIYTDMNLQKATKLALKLLVKGRKILVQLLIENGADVNAQGGNFGNALQAASCGNHKIIVQLLIEKGADVHAQGGCFDNALQAASRRGHERIVQLLIENGADADA